MTATTTPARRLRTVLIVDDLPQVRHDLRLLLELSGELEISGEAGTGLEALQMAQALQPEVILMDLEMPIMNGYEAAAQIKKLSPACRVIALSIHNYPAAWQRAAQAGMDGFIAKGAPLNVILDTIKERIS
jgi:two-component system nitrate/nitrite response regulator NarL